MKILTCYVVRQNSEARKLQCDNSALVFCFRLVVSVLQADLSAAFLCVYVIVRVYIIV